MSILSDRNNLFAAVFGPISEETAHLITPTCMSLEPLEYAWHPYLRVCPREEYTQAKQTKKWTTNHTKDTQSCL